MARPKHEPTKITIAQVEALASCGVPEDQIAEVIDVSPKTLRKHYKQILRVAHIKANGAVAAKLFQTAAKGNGPAAVQAQKFWLLCRAGWRPPATGGTAAPRADAPERVGKKDQAKAAAHAVATDSPFKTAPPPKTLQ